MWVAHLSGPQLRGPFGVFRVKPVGGQPSGYDRSLFFLHEEGRKRGPCPKR